MVFHARLLGIFTLGTAILAPFTARADAVGLQLAPLKYEQTITATTPQVGAIDVGNPSDTTVNITTSVQGFRQTDLSGDLTYYDDPILTDAITPGLSTFSLGARESVRVGFTVDPAKLPHGGIYAVIFFRTVPADQSASDSFVSQSAKVGTLLILNNGNATPVHGQLSVKLARLQFGNALSGTITYALPGGNVGIEPKLSSKLYGWGKATAIKTGLVLPASSRQFTLNRPGSYFGIIPVQIAEAGGTTTTAWTLAITGWYQTLVAIIVALLFARWFRRRYMAHETEPTKPSMDGLSRRG